MGYSIIFETKICKLNNGDIIHFNLSGCNNDDFGRRRDEFQGEYYTAEEWENKIREFESVKRHDNFDLKIGSRYVNWIDYGKHLRRMTKRAKTLEEYKKECGFYGDVFDGIRFYPNDLDEESIDYPAGSKEIDNITYGLWYGEIKGHIWRKHHRISTEEETIEAIKNGNHVSFYFGRKCKK